MEVRRVGSRYSFPLHAAPTFRRELTGRRFDVLVEDVNKLPLFTPLWGSLPVTVLVPHLFGTTAFLEERWPVAATVWLAERAMPVVYRGLPMQAISRSTAEDLARRGFPRERIRVIYPGLDHAWFRPDPSVGRYERPTFAYVGRLKRYKGIDVLVRAVAHLSEGGVDAHLVVAGRGDARAGLEKLAARLGVAERVEFAGFVTEERKREILRRAWANLYPSPKEGWGITNVEAAACGTPSVASDSPGLRESVAEGGGGFLVPHGDVRAWAGALAKLATDPGLVSRMGEGAREHAGRFSWERAADETERALAGRAPEGNDRAGSG